MAGDILKIYDRASVAWVIRSVVMQQKSEMERAFEAAGMAVKLSPDSPDAHLCMASVLASLGRFEQAIEEYNETLRLVEMISEFSTREKVNILLALAAAYASAGRSSESAATVEKAVQLTSLVNRQ
jgi:tetratricopeptide (TPR) repeat protein